MQPEQRVIADWLEATRKAKGWSWDQWAEEAGIGAATTLSRAVKEEYPSVTGIKTLHALAEAAGVRSPLDVLKEDAGERPPLPVPSAETLAPVLAAVLPLAARGRQTAQSLRVVAAALESGLQILSEQIANGEEPAPGVASRAAVARFRDLMQQ